MPPSPASEQLNGNPSPNLGRFGFGEPKTPDDLPSSSLPSPDLSSLEAELEDLAPDSGDDWPPDENDPSDGTSSPASTQVANPLNSEGLRDVFRGGVMIAGHQAHEYLARTDGQREVGLYLAEEDDAANIGDPLARVAARHQGVGKVTPDTADLLSAMVGLTRYATKQITRQRAAKELDSAGAGTPQPMPEAVDL